MVVQGSGTARFFLPEVVVFHEVQGNTRLCGQHVINNLLQQPKIDGTDLKKATEQIDTNEAMVMGLNPTTQFSSENAAADGYFNVPVIEHVLMQHKFSMNMFTRRSEGFDTPATVGEAFLVNRGDHWFCLRKIRDAWYECDSLKKAPMPLATSELNLKVKNYVNTGTVFSVFRVDGNLMPIPDDWITDLPHARGTLATHQSLQAQAAAPSSQPPSSTGASLKAACTKNALDQLPAEPDKGVTIAIRINTPGSPMQRHMRKFSPEGHVTLVVDWLRVLLPAGDAQLASSAPPPKKLALQGKDLFNAAGDKITDEPLTALLSVTTSTGESYNLTRA